MKKILGLLGMMMLMLVSCDNTIHVTFDQETFNTQRAAWQASGVTKYSYVYVSRWGTIPNEKLLIDVSGDEITVTDKETGEPYAMSENFRIEDLYNSIEALYNQYNGMTKPVCETYSYYDNIEVTYDTENHIPTKIYAKGQSGNGQTFGFYNHDKKIEDFQKK